MIEPPSLDQFSGNLAATALVLSQDEIARLDAVSKCVATGSAEPTRSGSNGVTAPRAVA